MDTKHGLGEFITLIVDLSDRSRHQIRVEERILRAKKNDIYSIAAEQQGHGNIPEARIINVRHARAGEQA